MLKITISAFFAGAVCKMYDDLVDNPKLQKYKTEFLLELLKGLHYILFTSVSINDPIYFCGCYLTCLTNSICDKKAFENEYEYSLLYSFLIMFLLIDYNYPFLSIFYELFGLIFALLIGVMIEVKVSKKECSFWKLIMRIIGLCIFSFLYLNVSSSFKNSIGYIIGYLSVSVMIQFYSLFLISEKKENKKKNKKKNKKARMQ